MFKYYIYYANKIIMIGCIYCPQLKINQVCCIKYECIYYNAQSTTKSNRRFGFPIPTQPDRKYKYDISCHIHNNCKSRSTRFESLKRIAQRCVTRMLSSHHTSRATYSSIRELLVSEHNIIKPLQRSFSRKVPVEEAL